MKNWLSKFHIIRRVKNFSLVLMSFLIISVTLLSILLGTDRGFSFLLETASDFTEGAFKYKQATGNLLSGLKINQLIYNDSEIEVVLKEVELDWQPKQLFNRRVMINSIIANGIQFKQLNTTAVVKTNTPNKPVTLPEILLPVDIHLQQLQITGIDIQTDPSFNTPPVHINLVTLKADLIQSKIKLHALALEMPDINTILNGQVELTNNYPLSLQNNVTLQVPVQPEEKNAALNIKGSIKGNIKSLKLAQQTTGLMTSSLKAEANNLLSELNWKTDILLSQLTLKTFMPEQNGTIKANIQSHGDLKQANVSLTADLMIEASNLKSETKKAQIALNTNIIFAEQQFKAEAQWKNLQWPLNGLAAYASDTGIVDIQGTPENYTLALQFALSGSDIPKGNWQAEANGNLEQVKVPFLQGKTLNGVIDVTSQVSWNKAIKWQANIKTDKVDPGQFFLEFPGSLDIELNTSGEMLDETIQAHLKLKQFSGQLLSQPLAGGGEINLLQEKAQTSINVDHFNLSSGQAKLKANGQINDKFNLDWSLAVAELTDLLPTASGQMTGKGQLRGTLEAPRIVADLAIDNIQYQDIQLQKADIQSDLNLNPDITSKLHIKASNLMLSTDASQTIKEVKIKLDGPFNQHKFTAIIEHDMAKLNLATSGKLDTEQLSWAGTINQLSINSPDFGHWQQDKPSKLFASATKTNLSNLCLYDQTAQLCSQLNWTPQKGNANLNLSQFSFERARPFLPEEIKKFTGSVDLQANIDLGPVLLAHVETKIEPGSIIYQPIGKKSIQLNHHDGLIEADYSAKQLQTKWNLNLGPHQLDGKIQMPRSSLDNDPMTAPIQGDVNIDIKDLNILSIIIPQINEIQGHLFSKLELAGNLSAPQVNGKAELVARSIDIPDLGTQFSDLNININSKDNGKALVIDGRLNSKKGYLSLDGLILLDAEQQFPINMKVIGENFLAINIPDVYAVLSPDIHFSQKEGLMGIKGKLIIPEASIAPSSIPEGSIDVSSDVIILGEEEKVPPNMNLDVSIELGEKVHLRAFGLKTDLAGAISISQKPKQLIFAHGELRLENGIFRAYGQDLTIDEGSVFYTGGHLDNPGLKFTASRQVKETKVGIKVSGTARKPNLDTFSDDTSLTDKDIVALMLTGQKSDNLENAKIYAGADINDKLSVGINAGMGDEGSEFVTRYRLTDKVQLEGTSSSAKSGGSILYTFELE